MGCRIYSSGGASPVRLDIVVLIDSRCRDYSLFVISRSAPKTGGRDKIAAIEVASSTAVDLFFSAWRSYLAARCS